MATAEFNRAADFRAEFWGGSLDGIAGALGYPMRRRTYLMFVTLTGAVLGGMRTSSQQLFGASNIALSFALCCLDVAFLAARILVCSIAPSLQADLKALRLELFATDASLSGAGVCAAPVTDDL